MFVFRARPQMVSGAALKALRHCSQDASSGMLCCGSHRGELPRKPPPALFSNHEGQCGERNGKEN